MFFESIYGSWEKLQTQKYQALVNRIGNIFSGKYILDLGGGRGYFSNFLGKKDIFVIDNNIESLLNNNSHFKILGNGNNLPFKKIFDIVVGIDIAHLISLDDVKNVLKNNGILIIGMFFNENGLRETLNYIFGKLSEYKVLDVFTSIGKENEVFVISTLIS